MLLEDEGKGVRSWIPGMESLFGIHLWTLPTHLAANPYYLYSEGRSEKAETWLGFHQTRSASSHLITLLWVKFKCLQDRGKIIERRAEGCKIE